MADDLAYIRQHYNVPAHKGRGVLVRGKPAQVVGASGPHVKIRLQGERIAHPYHPKDEAISWWPVATKLDGLGQPIVDDAKYYLQDARTYVGNSMSWWRPDGAGYTCDIDDAGVYTGAQARGHRETDVPWPVDVVLRNTKRHVDWQTLRNERLVDDQPLTEARRG